MRVPARRDARYPLHGFHSRRWQKLAKSKRQELNEQISRLGAMQRLVDRGRM